MSAPRGGATRGHEPAKLSEAEFALFQALIYREAGIALGPSKRELLFARLARRVRELELRSYGAYYRAVIEDLAGEELAHLLDAITTNETHFFREPVHFELLERDLIPAWREAAEAGGPRRIRIWSAGCSTGEEPASIAMTLLRHFPPGSGWDLEVLATDVSRRVLARAESAVWPIEKMREIPEPDLKRFMLRGVADQGGLMKAGPEVRSVIRHHRLNLNDERWPVTGPFQAIFCRNVLIYFDAASRAPVLARLVERLDDAGHLFLGHAETLDATSLGLRCMRPTVYRRRTPCD